MKQKRRTNVSYDQHTNKTYQTNTGSVQGSWKEKERTGQNRKEHNDSSPLSVQVHNNNIESAIRLFRRKIDDAGIMDTIRNGRYYEKPSIIRREKKKEQSFKHQIKRKQEEDSQVSHNRSKRRRKK